MNFKQEYTLDGYILRGVLFFIFHEHLKKVICSKKSLLFEV